MPPGRCGIVWAAGNESSPLGQFLGAPLDRAGRVRVQPDLSVPGHAEVFVVGDLAAHHLPRRQPVTRVRAGRGLNR